MAVIKPYLAKQFVFAPDGVDVAWVADDFDRHRVPDGRLYTGRNLPVQLIDGPGKPLGIWLGWPIGPDSICPRHPEPGESIENYIYAHSGSFIFIEFLENGARFYLDACGSLSLVYDTRRKIVASTAWAALGPSEYYERFWPEQSVTYNISGHGWIPAGETAHRGVIRLMANHFLESPTGEVVRHWPSGPLYPADDDEATLGSIADHCQIVIRNALARGNAIMSLTAGNESRLLMSCMPDALTQIPYFTVVEDERSVDFVISKRLADRFDLDWRALSVVNASAEERARWDLSVGACLTGANREQHPTVDRLGSKIFIGGLGGEIGRAFLWRNRNNRRMVTPLSLARRLKLPASAQLLANFDKWLSQLPSGMDVTTIYELAYIELRMSCWAFAQSYTNPQLVPIAPLISRQCFTDMLSLNYKIRKSQTFSKMIIQNRNPELLSIPINSKFNMKKYTAPFSGAMQFVLSTIR